MLLRSLSDKKFSCEPTTDHPRHQLLHSERCYTNGINLLKCVALLKLAPWESIKHTLGRHTLINRLPLSHSSRLPDSRLVGYFYQLVRDQKSEELKIEE